MAGFRYNVSLPILILKEGKYFIAYTPALDLATSGKTFKQVQERFTEVVKIFFDELSEKGTLEKVLSELGWQKHQKEWIPPIVVANETQNVSVHLAS